MEAGVSVLGVPVGGPLLARWRGWLAPDAQPFVVEEPSAFGFQKDHGSEVSPELRDTFKLWAISKDDPLTWLSEEEFTSLDRSSRAGLVRRQVRAGRGQVPAVRAWADLIDASVLRAQSDGHRFVWWPSLITDEILTPVLTRVVERQRLPSRHEEVPEATWRSCEEVVPGARSLGGTFAGGSGPNCFSTVMAASGQSEAGDAWVMQDQFQGWLGETTRQGGADQDPGTVLVWMDSSDLAQHAAVTLGDGWALEKASQEWHSPRAVTAVGDVIRTARYPGNHLRRFTLNR